MIIFWKKYWFWECLLLVNKCFLTGVLTVIAPGTPLQLLSALLICTAYLLSVFKFAPFVGDHADIIASLASGSLCITYLIGFYESAVKHTLKEADGDGHAGASEAAISEDVLGALLIAVNVVPLVFFVFSNVWHYAVVAPTEKKKRRLARRIENTNKSTKKAMRSGGRMTAVAPAIIPSSEVGVGQADTPAGNSKAEGEDIRSWG